MIIDNAIKYLLVFAFGIFFALGIFFAIYDNFRTSIMFLTVGFLCLIFIFLSRFKRFKGFGFEAELWESKQEEAEQMIVLLRSLAITVSRQILTLSSRAGRIHSATPRDELFALRDNIDQILVSANVPASERENVASEFYRYTAIDMIHNIFDKIAQNIGDKKIDSSESPIKIKSDIRKAVQMANDSKVIEFIFNIIENYAFLNESDKKVLKSGINGEIEDLREWITKRNLRRRADWFSKDPMKG